MLFRYLLKLSFKITFLLTLYFPMSIIGQDVPPPFSFNLAPRYQIGLNTIQTRYADLDGDGFLDAIAVNGGQANPHPTITIIFGTSNGGFSSPSVLPSYVDPYTITAGDINNDGKLDLVAGGWYQNKISVYLNQGNRQFASPVISTPPDPPYQGLPYGEFFDLAIADFDGDGNNDLVALQDQINQRIRFFHFSGNGSLTVFATLNQYGADTSYEGEMTVGDINGDNRPDIVFANGGPFGVRTICFVFGQPIGGNLALTYGFDVQDKAVGFSIADLDNDGDNDLAVAFLDVSTPTRHSLQIFQNNGSGTLTPMPKIFLEYPFPPDDITTGDFNNDGIRDIAALVGSVYDSGIMVMVTYGRGDCTYSGEKYYGVSSSSSIFSADINRDGKIDLITASSFLLQTDYSQYPGLSNNTVSVLVNDNLRGFKAPLVKLWGPNFIDAADFNNDGYKDMVSSWTTIFHDLSSADISINDRRDGFFEEVSYASPAALTGMKTGDFNGDGKADAVTTHATYDNILQIAVYFGDGSGSLGTPVVTPLAHAVNKMIVGDFNLDGKDDLFVLDSTGKRFCMLSAGNGSFVIAPPISLSNANNGIQKGDFNGDHKLDLVITDGSSVKLWIGDGTGQFLQSAASIPNLANVVPGDFNGDGKLDLAGMTGTTGNVITGILGDGNGGFAGSFSEQIRNFSFSTTQSIVTADFDRDGFDDVAMIMGDNTFGNLIIVTSGGSTPSWREPIFPSVATATKELIAADFNGDGRPDLGYLGDNSRGVIYNTIALPRSNTKFDYDGDGKSDVSVYRPSVGNWYLNRSTAGFLGVHFGLADDVLTPADFTGDGKTDVAVWRPSSGTWFMLKSEDFTFDAFQFGTSGDIPAPGDYDGDGKADRVVYRPSTGVWYLQQTTAGFAAVQFGIAEDKPSIGDFDGDGKNDIAVYRPSQGNGYRLNSSNGAFAAVHFGSPGDMIVPADYTGDGKTDVAVWRPSSGVWYVLRSEDLSFYGAQFGLSTDIPAPGDYDGDGKADLGVFRPSEGVWYLQQSTSGFAAVQFGLNGDRPTPNAYVY